MSAMKKTLKSKFLEDDEISEFVVESQFLQDSPKGKKTQKRQKSNIGDEDMTKLMDQFQVSASKKKKADPSVEMCKESRKRILDVMGHQLETRKQSVENLLKKLTEVVSQSEADYNVMKENEKKLEQLTGALLKCVQQASAAEKQNIIKLKDILSRNKKEWEELEAEHKNETDKLTTELEADIQKLQKKLITETKRSGWESLRKTIFHAMQNDF